MNYRLILQFLGSLLQFEGAFLLLPFLVGLYYHESQAKYLLIIAAAAAAIGTLMRIIKPKSKKLHPKEGFIVTALSWLLMSLTGAMPFFISGEIPSFTDAVFETASGFTTTGASILTDIEGMARCMLFWRSFTHWIGGMGVLVFMLIFLKSTADEMNLMKAESTGPEVDKTMPRLRSYAMLLYGIYIGLTVIEIILLRCGGMYWFDSVTVAFSTAGTGGFASYNNSMAYFHSYYLQGVVSVFMMLFGVNFYVYILILTKKIKHILKLEEMWFYFGLVAFFTVVIAINIYSIYKNAFDSFHQSFFYVNSMLSSTGYAIEDTDKWPMLSKAMVCIMTCIGACAGSTGGGFKVSRVLILLKEARKEFRLIIHPRNVENVRMNGKKVSHETTRNVSVYLIIYILFIIVSASLISINGFDFTTNFTSVLATLNNTGPGFSMVGSAGNFAKFSVFSKIVFCFNMIAGRLELYPLLLVFMPRAWRKN